MSAQAAIINVPADYPTISAAVAAASPGDEIVVAPGTYNENVLINKNNLTLRSSGGKAVTTIIGTLSGGNGTVMIANGINGVTIGKPGQGFKIVGYDGPGTIETAAVYLLGAHQNITIEDNEIEANGEHGLLANFNAAINNIIIRGNHFTGKTFSGAEPGGCGFSTQFDPGNNVPRQLVTLGGGAGVTNSMNITFVGNVITGTAGGFNSAGPCEQGNFLVTIDVIGATISDNVFNGVTTRFAGNLRARGQATTVKCNTFYNVGLGAGCTHIFFGSANPLTGSSTPTLAAVASQNAFPNGGAYLTPDHPSTYIIYRDNTQAAIAAAAVGAGQTVNSASPGVTVTCPPNTTVCQDDAPFALTGGSPSGGTYSGPGVSGGTFDPSAAGVGTHTITYTYTDVNGCTSSCTFTITVKAQPKMVAHVNSVTVTNNNDGADDTGAFTVCGGVPNNVSITTTFSDLNGAPNARVFQTISTTNATFSPWCNSCQALLTAFVAGTNATATAVNPNLAGTVTVTWQAWQDDDNDGVMDAEECKADKTIYTITVHSAPALTCPTSPVTANTAPGLCNTTVGYAVIVSGFPAPTLSYTFTGATTGSGSGTGSGSTFNKGTTTVTITATNSCGTATCTFDVVVNDNESPVVTPGTIASCYSTVAAAEAAAITATTATDNCPPAPTKTASTSLSGCTATITVTATDGSGNTATATYTTTIDNTPPSITCPGAQTLTLGPTCTASLPDYTGLATVSDACSTPTVAQSPAPGTTVSGAGPMTVTLTATDGCGYTATCTFTVNKVDVTPPTFTFVPANVTVQCNSVPPVGTPTATDACGPVTIQYLSQTTTSGSCPDAYTLTRTWKATDGSGNSTTAAQTITVIDTQKPNFTSVPANVTVQCNAIPAVGTPTATDNCDTHVAITYNGQTTTAGTCPNRYTLTRRWTAEDNCGNTRSTSQVITVIDTNAPFFTSFPANVTISCSAPAPPVGTPTATDACGPATVQYLGQTTANSVCPGTYQIRRTWRATDQCGNSTASTQIIQVTDNTPPVFTSVPGPITINCNDPLPPLVNPTASDACSPYVHITFLGNTPSGSGCASDYTIIRTWRADDLCGNSATATQVITVKAVPFSPGSEERERAQPQTPTWDDDRILTLQPNPTTDRVLIGLGSFAGERVVVSIHNDMGQLVWQRTVDAVPDLLLPVSLRESGASAGLYTVSVRSSHRVVAKRLVIIE